MTAEEYGKKEAERFTYMVNSLSNEQERQALEGMFALAYQKGYTAGATAAGEVVKQIFAGSSVNGEAEHV